MLRTPTLLSDGNWAALRVAFMSGSIDSLVFLVYDVLEGNTCFVRFFLTELIDLIYITDIQLLKFTYKVYNNILYKVDKPMTIKCINKI